MLVPSDVRTKATLHLFDVLVNVFESDNPTCAIKVATDPLTGHIYSALVMSVIDAAVLAAGVCGTQFDVDSTLGVVQLWGQNSPEIIH